MPNSLPLQWRLVATAGCGTRGTTPDRQLASRGRGSLAGGQPGWLPDRAIRSPGMDSCVVPQSPDGA
jgi:hypothetical protein